MHYGLLLILTFLLEWPPMFARRSGICVSTQDLNIVAFVVHGDIGFDARIACMVAASLPTIRNGPQVQHVPRRMPCMSEPERFNKETTQQFTQIHLRGSMRSNSMDEVALSTNIGSNQSLMHGACIIKE